MVVDGVVDELVIEVDEAGFVDGEVGVDAAEFWGGVEAGLVFIEDVVEGRLVGAD